MQEGRGRQGKGRKGKGGEAGDKPLLLFSFAGFDAVTVANNHFNDFGSEGANFSLEILKNIGIRYFGISFGNYDASQVQFYHFFRYTLLDVRVLPVVDLELLSN